jgi:hypothetical protein
MATCMEKEDVCIRITVCILVRHGPIAAQLGNLPCIPLFLSRGMPIPSDLSDFPLENSCGNGTYVFDMS